MALVPILSDEDASPEAQVMYKHSKQMFGRVANAMRVASHSPKLAQSILSGMQPQRLLRLLREADAKGLRQAPGVGPKLAERIAVELRDDSQKLAGRLAARGVDATSVEIEPEDPAEELLSALTNLGYPPARASRVVDSALAEAPPDSSLEALIRVALRRLSQ